METAIATEPALVEGSTTTVVRIVTNLLANALKFTPEGGNARVSVGADAVHVVVRVDDSGPGINDDDAPHVFERFYRSPDPVTRQTPGTGLGLSIVRSLVELMGGTIAVERSPLDGAGMVVRLPRASGRDEHPS